MHHKYKIMTRNKRPVLFWYWPSKRALFLVSVAVICLISTTLWSLDCLSPQNLSYLCPINFRKQKEGLEIAYYRDVTNSYSLKQIPERLPVLLGTKSLELSALENDISQDEDMINVSELQKIIDDVNQKQKIWNLEKFGEITSDTIIIVIQAHKRLEYLKALIKSLGESKYIENTLIVFSHGFYSEDINNVVRNITFARVLQIFFPYSLQTHLNTFPGFSPNDCPHGISKEIVTMCQGHPRDVKSLQVKHHWWWKVNMVFNGLRVTRMFNGLVFLLEEDHFVFPDFLHVLRLMREIAPKKCPDCNIFGLGLNPKPTSKFDYRGNAHKVSGAQWNNMGFGFDRQFWNGLNRPKCSDMFCEYNDYNWDFTLAYLSHKCLPQELKPLNVVSSRVFHIGDCGLHFHGQNCTAQQSLMKVYILQQNVLEFLFPRTLEVVDITYLQRRVDGHNGGWDDPRDIQLCKNISRGYRW